MCKSLGGVYCCDFSSYSFSLGLYVIYVIVLKEVIIKD